MGMSKSIYQLKQINYMYHFTSSSFGSFFIPSKALSSSSLFPHGSEPTNALAAEELVKSFCLLSAEMLAARLSAVFSFPFVADEELVSLLNEDAEEA